MKSTLLLLALAAAALGAKTCTPSFDYCAEKLISDKGFTEADLEAVLKAEDLETADLKNVLFHCKNPGDVGHAKVCPNGCRDPGTDGSHDC
ncbi:hypothetical protein CNMCM5793_001606 [Aspergillus hiratsukae]|uniref:Uncharacterized protein n=1 Tax=Aspergillus hiratsukae TaxID=1194566 RepID=A0A8H6Q1D5_9EURO|nr:hypothetical protein CNMCM5793_001606 [Aspergillus hiratsukae]KAF7165135.1 hypothetical protein CNMCM6106_001375 [Aspergillus hiratsukae]